MIVVGCSRCTYPSIHLFVSKSRSVVRGAVVCCVCMRVLCCVVCCVVCVWCVLLVLVLVFGGGVVWWWCGVVWCGVVCIFVVFLFFLSTLFLSCSLSLSFLLLSSFLSSLFSLLSSLPLFLLSSLLATKHYGKNRSTNTAANIEAFECDLAQGKCRAFGSLPPPLPSLLPSPSLLLKKKRKLFFLQEYIRRGNYFVLQFYLNSEKSLPGEITVITVLY